MTSPTQRTLAALRADGWWPEITEKWIPRARIRKDLWTFCDVLALKDGRILAVQCTSGSNGSARVRKIADCELLPLVRAAGIEIQVWAWRKLKSGWAAKIVDMS